MAKYKLVGVSCVSSLIGAVIGAKWAHAEEKTTENQLKLAILDRFRFQRTGSLSHDVNNTNVNIPLPIVSAATPSVPALPRSQRPTDRTDHSLVTARSEEIMKYGFPGFDNIRTYGDHVLSYDCRTRNARWVFEHLTRDRVKSREGIDRENSKFVEDTSIHGFFRATNDDFKRSGYDRGHLAAAANHRHCQRAMDETFVLSNITPQVGVGFNRGAWCQLEKYIRVLAKKFPNVYVCSGPLYLSRPDQDGKTYVRYEVLGRSQVAVPTHFFKVVLVEKPESGFELLSFVMPNENIGDTVDLRNYLVPLDSVERAAGFLVFSAIPRNNIKRINGI